MAVKLTPSQKAERRLEQKAQIAAQAAEYERQRQEHLVMYKASIPKRLMDAQALAASLGIAVHVSLTATGPSVRFEYEDHHGNDYIDETITYETEEWELENLESILAARKAKRDAYDARRVVADGVWARLSDDEKVALKEHILWMRT